MAVRRRRRKYTWLPTQGTGPAVEGDISTSTQITSLIVESNPEVLGPVASVEFPFVNDFPQDVGSLGEGSTTEGIGEIIGNDYVVERIVGKIFVGYTAVNNTSGNTTVIVKCGIFVARSDGQSPDLPIGLTPNNYSPLALQNVREPWMFLRTWLLNGGLAQNSNPFASARTSFGTQGQTNTLNNAGVYEEGPHIDVRSVRRVRQDERLFITFSAQGYNPTGDGTTGQTGNVRIVTDLRALGALRRSKNRSSF